MFLFQTSRREENLELPDMVMKRRVSFPSSQKALESLSRKPPYVLFDHEVMQLYVQHGIRPYPGMILGTFTIFDSAQEKTSICTHADGRGVRLRCSRETEAAIFTAWIPLAHVDCSRVRCPVFMAQGGQSKGPFAALLQSGAAVHHGLKNSRLER